MQNQLEQIVEENFERKYYIWGGEQVENDTQDVVAKSSHDKGFNTNSYWIKKATFGPEAGCMYNPLSPTFDRYSLGKVGNGGRKAYEYKRVTEQSFNLYIQFIKTQNTLFLKNAERV